MSEYKEQLTIEVLGKTYEMNESYFTAGIEMIRYIDMLKAGAAKLAGAKKKSPEESEALKEFEALVRRGHEIVPEMIRGCTPRIMNDGNPVSEKMLVKYISLLIDLCTEAGKAQNEKLD